MAAHLIQLVVNSGLKEGFIYSRFLKLIAKCKKIAGLDKWSNRFSHLSKRISQTAEVRWNSYCSMIKGIIFQIEDIDDALKILNETELLIHVSDVKV